MEKLDPYNKKMKFKQGLDAQISQRGNKNQQENARDQAYYRYVMEKGTEQRKKEERERMERQAKRMEMEEGNRHIIDGYIRDSRSQTSQNQYNLDIGVKSEMEQKKR